MHIVGINFISFTAQNNALHMLGKKDEFWHVGGMAPLPPPLNPPMFHVKCKTFGGLGFTNHKVVFAHFDLPNIDNSCVFGQL